MKKLIISIVGALLLLLWVDMALAQGGGKDPNGQGRTGGVEPRIRPPRAEKADPNSVRQRVERQEKKGDETPAAASERERLREAARQRMRDRVEQRREAQGAAGGDANAPGRPLPPFARDRAKGGEQADDKQAGKGPDHQQQLKAAGHQVAHEEGKHLQRTAKLERIRELAQQEGDTKTVERVDKLIEKEKQRYDTKKQRAETRKERIAQFIQARSDANAPAMRPLPRKPAEPNEQ